MMEELSVSIKEDVKPSRRIYLTGTFDEGSIQSIIKTIFDMNEQDDKGEREVVGFVRQPIEMYINSPGGSVYECIGLINVMENSKTPIHTYVWTKAMSAGFWTFISGHKRFVHPRASLMVHDMAYGAVGTNVEIKESVEQSDALWKVLEDIILDKTKITKKKIDKMLEKKQDWHLFGKEAIKYGIADELIKKD